MSTTTYDPRMTAYFGDPILRAGFMPLPHLLMRHYHDMKLGTDQAMFAMQLMEINWDLAQPPNTMKKLAARMGVSLRTVQRYSEHLVALGLLIVYEQFEDGAQVENGYDLTPLFQRLATFAPEPPPTGAIRERRVRGATLEHTSVSRALPIATDIIHNQADKSGTSPHVTSDTPPNVTSDIPSHVEGDTPNHDSSVIGATIRSSGLNGIKEKLLKNKQEQPKKRHGGGVSNNSLGPSTMISSPHHPDIVPGRSIRTNAVLTHLDIAQNLVLLDHLGIHNTVSSVVAKTVAPADVWTLAAYSCAARLGPVWIASQIYDFTKRQPQASDLATRYDAVGHVLATLEPSDARRLLDSIDQHYPGNRVQLENDFRKADSHNPLEALDIVWKLFVEQRGCVERTTATLSMQTEQACSSTDSHEYAQLWQVVLARLASEVATDDLRTWLSPTRLLDIQGDTVIIGAPNVFVRDQVETYYKTHLLNALRLELEHSVDVACVIGT